MNGFDAFLAALKSEAEAVQAALSAPPLACPKCGKPFTSGPNGERHCTFDGYIWDGKQVNYGQ